MKNIEIKIPKGKVAKQENTSNGIVITFEDEKKKSIIERIITFDDVLSEASKDALDDYYRAMNCCMTPERDAYTKLKLICNVAWEGVQVDWNNSNQYIYWPWFKLSSGFGFDHSSYYYVLTGTFVGSRLCYPSEETSDYFAKLFIDIYKEWLT